MFFKERDRETEKEKRLRQLKIKKEAFWAHFEVLIFLKKCHFFLCHVPACKRHLDWTTLVSLSPTRPEFCHLKRRSFWLDNIKPRLTPPPSASNRVGLGLRWGLGLGLKTYVRMHWRTNKTSCLYSKIARPVGGD